MKTCVIIPTYNEAKSIALLIRQIRGQGLQIIVIDDGSNDLTSEIAKGEGAVVLRNQANEGKGACLIQGFDYALKKDFEAVITMDGDGQHLPEEIPYFMRLATYSNSGIIIGNRMSKKRNMPLLRVLTNTFMSWLLSKIVGQKIPDTQCGFRLIKRNVLEKIKFDTHRYETESEILIKASRLGFKIESVPIKTVYSGEKSHIHPVKDSLRFIGFIVRDLWTARH